MAIERYKNGWRVNVHTGKSAANLPAPYTGKRRLTKVVTSSHAAAKKIEREYKDLVEECRLGSPDKINADDFKPEFLELCNAGSTRLTYDFALRNFLRDHGKKPLADWTEREARQCAANLPKGNVIVVKTMFARAVERGHIDRNPFREVAPSTGRQIRTKEDFHKLWPRDPKEQQKLFTHIIETAAEHFGPDAAGLTAWAGWVGTRPGESFVLRRENLDLAADLATIDSNFDRSSQQSSRGTKNHLSRIVVVAPLDELRRSLSQMPVHINQPYVFTNNGKPWRPATWSNRWSSIRRLAGCPEMRFYDLRHFCATQLLEMGITAEDVAIQLGHTDGGELVRTVYGHPSEDAARDRIRHMMNVAANPNGHALRHINQSKGA